MEVGAVSPKAGHCSSVSVWITAETSGSGVWGAAVLLVVGYCEPLEWWGHSLLVGPEGVKVGGLRGGGHLTEKLV